MAGARTRRFDRYRKMLPFLEELEEYTQQAHEGASFHIDRGAFTALWAALPISRTRDARALELSNWTVISNDLCERFPDTVTVHSFGHFGHGWYERLYVYKDDPMALRAAQQWVDALQSHGIADEEHYSETEYEENHPSETECYSSDPDCGCPVKTHECSQMLSDGIASGDISSDSEEWYCDFCQEWNDLDDEWREKAASYEHRQALAAAEAMGQLRLFAA